MITSLLLFGQETAGNGMIETVVISDGTVVPLTSNIPATQPQPVSDHRLIFGALALGFLFLFWRSK